VDASSSAPGTRPAHVLNRNTDKFWMPKKKEITPYLTFELTGEKTFDCLEIRENIRYGQRIEQFSVEVWKGERWREVTRATTVGYSRFLRFEPVTSAKVRVRIIQSRSTPALAFVALHKRLPGLVIKPESGAFLDSLQVVLASDSDSDRIFYTLDGSKPDQSSLKYTGPLLFTQSTSLQAIAVDSRGVESFLRKGNFTKADFSIRFADPPSPQYQPKSRIVLMDGRIGEPDYTNGEWLGWEGRDMVAEIDLGANKNFKAISADFLFAPASWVFLPLEVVFEFSSNGRNYQTAGRVSNDQAWDKFTGVRKEFGISGDFSARYLRVKAVGTKTCPAGHAGAGNPCWLFADEIRLVF
jgi:hypothetical protein